MEEKKLVESIKYLVTKYLNERNDLINLITQDPDSVKYILSEINKGKKGEYDKEDLEILQDISFYYL